MNDLILCSSSMFTKNNKLMARGDIVDLCQLSEGSVVSSGTVILVHNKRAIVLLEQINGRLRRSFIHLDYKLINALKLADYSRNSSMRLQKVIWI